MKHMMCQKSQTNYGVVDIFSTITYQTYFHLLKTLKRKQLSLK